MGLPGGWELIVIVLVIIVMFGGKKIPELAKGLGKGIKEFKEEMNDVSSNTATTEEPVKKVEADKSETSQQNTDTQNTTKQA